MSARHPAFATLRAVATECLGAAASFCISMAALGLVVADELRALFPAAASSAVRGPSAAEQTGRDLLSVVPPELLSIILSLLNTRDLACLAATCRSLWCDAPTPPPLPPPGLVATELRRRAEARGLHIASSLPEGAPPWVPYLLKRELYDALRRQAPLTVGHGHSIFVDREGRLHLACRREEIEAGRVGEPLLDHDWASDAGASTQFVPPALVPSMQGKRIVSVVSGHSHCLALSAEGEVYSWGDGFHGALGHADGDARAGPNRIETLERVESIAAGTNSTSAAVDYRGSLFTWGRAWSQFHANEPSGLGYELDPETQCQLAPKRVDALLVDRVVGVALGSGFTLAVTDAGAVFSFGLGCGALGHGPSLESEVLPRLIKGLAQTGRRFVAVAAGGYHALALAEGGQLYWWGKGRSSWHGLGQRTPRLMVELAGERVKLAYAQGFSACAVTEKGELFTWGHGGHYSSLHLGHGVGSVQQTPKRVEALRRVKVAAAAICSNHTLVADEDGVVWAIGGGSEGLGLGGADARPEDRDTKDEKHSAGRPTLFPNLRVRTLK